MMQNILKKVLTYFVVAVVFSSFLAVMKGVAYDGQVHFPGFWGTLHKFVHIFILTILGFCVFYLSKIIPFERDKLYISIPVYSIAAFIFGILQCVAYYLFLYVIFLVGIDPYNPEIGGIFTTYFRYSLMAYWVILGFCLAFNYYHENQKRKEEAARYALKASRLETKLIEAQLQTLKMQLQPHFLFNTLHTINGLIVDSPVEAKRTIALLSDLLRISFEKTVGQSMRLKDELDILGKYLDIQKTRFKDRLKVEMDIQPESLDASVPTLIMQPVTENAISHGIAPYKKPGCLKIVSRRENSSIVLEVHDSGEGIKNYDEVEKSNGIGVSNTRERLKHLYPDNHSFEMKQSPVGGLLVAMRLPFIRFEDQNNNQDSD